MYTSAYSIWNLSETQKQPCQFNSTETPDTTVTHEEK